MTPGSGNASTGPVQTLSAQDPQLAARHAAYLARKKSKRESRKNVVDHNNFLSNLQETDADVAYRFNFTVTGFPAGDVVNALVSSDAALGLGGAGPQSGAHRCFCEVKFPPGQQNQGQGGGRKLSKLALSILNLEEDSEPCETRQEAMGSAIVYCLSIDSKAPNGESNFRQQLDLFEANLARLRARSKARLRPVKAVLLCCEEPEGTSGALQSWAVQLADFEQNNGDMWKFGPICLRDGDVIHATFAEMTSTRILHTQKDESEEGPPKRRPGEDADKDGEALGGGGEVTFRPSAGTHVHTGRRRASTASDAGSSCSEQERPPIFETEMSGSECSDGALENHERAFGVADLPSPRGQQEREVSPPAAPLGGGPSGDAPATSAAPGGGKEASPRGALGVAPGLVDEEDVKHVTLAAAEKELESRSAVNVTIEQDGKSYCCTFC